MVEVNWICILVIMNIKMVGKVIGRKLEGKKELKWRINEVKRKIKEKKWLMENEVIVIIGGVLNLG
jgi:hypothetical protein